MTAKQLEALKDYIRAVSKYDCAEHDSRAGKYVGVTSAELGIIRMNDMSQAERVLDAAFAQPAPKKVFAFEDWDEVNEHISEIRAEAEKRFGKDFSDPSFDE